MRGIVFILTWLFSIAAFAQPDSCSTLKVHFLYGSKPATHYRHEEARYFGGLHGGHVSLESNDSVFSFRHASPVHIFAHRKNRHSRIENIPASTWAADTAGKKYLTVFIPLTPEQCAAFHRIKQQYSAQVPYDYAFFGMRCAASAYDVLSHSGIFKTRSRFGMVVTAFYPKLLRKKVMRLAAGKHYPITLHDGSPRRKWERH